MVLILVLVVVTVTVWSVVSDESSERSSDDSLNESLDDSSIVPLGNSSAEECFDDDTSSESLAIELTAIVGVVEENEGEDEDDGQTDDIARLERHTSIAKQREVE